MKKFLIASGVAVLALASVASAQGYTFSANLTVGSTGPDVVALQTWLIANGYSIPSVSSGAAAKGYYGSQTKSAVAKFQAAKGLPSTGFFGPLTRGILNGGSSSMTTGTTAVTCPAGYVCTAVTGTGTGTTPSAPVGISTPGVAGTLAASLWTTPSGVTTYKGQSYDVASYKLQAAASDMGVTSMSLDFSDRLWLYANTITLKDETGAVVGTVNNLNASSFSELTVGSKYRISVPVNFVVKATQSKYITVNVSFNAVSDRSNTTLSIVGAQVRSLDGTGVTDTQTVSDARTFTYNSTNIGQVVVTIDTNSPATGLVQMSTAAQTQNVPLAIYDVKSQNEPSTLQTLTVSVQVVPNGSSATVATLFSNIQLKAGNLTYSASSISNPDSTGSSTVVFSNLQIPLAADTYVPLTISATVAQDTNNTLDNATASTTLIAGGASGGASNNPAIVDATYNNLAVNGATFRSNTLQFTATGVQASNLAVSYGGLNTNNSNGSTTQQVTFTYSLTAGNNPIYVSKTQNTAITAAVSGTTGFYVNSVNFYDNDSSNDGSTYFYIAPGATKTFTAIYSAQGPSGSSGTLKATQLNYSTSSTLSPTLSLTASTIANTLQATLFH